MPGDFRFKNLSRTLAVIALILGLYVSAQCSYLLFHTLIEIATVAIAFSLFILTWNTHRFQTNNFLGILGIGYAFIALIDLLHTLAYKGMNVFPGHGANLATQFWIAARSLQAVTLCAAPFSVLGLVGICREIRMAELKRENREMEKVFKRPEAE